MSLEGVVLTEQSAWKGVGIANRNEQHQIKRRTVLRVAAQAFSKSGFHKTTLVDIARQLNITKATLYHYFKNKDDILWECHKAAIDAVVQPSDPADDFSTGDWKSSAEKLHAFIHRYVAMLCDDFGTCLIMTGTAALGRENREKCISGRRHIDNMLRVILTEGVDDGSIAACDSRLTASFIFGAMNWVCHWYDPRGSLGVEELAEEVIVFVARGLEYGQDADSAPLQIAGSSRPVGEGS